MKIDDTAVSYNGALPEAGLAVNPASPSETAAIEISEIAALPDMKKSAACVEKSKIVAQQQVHKGEAHSEQAPSTDSATQPICADKVCWTTALVALSRSCMMPPPLFCIRLAMQLEQRKKLGVAPCLVADLLVVSLPNTACI